MIRPDVKAVSAVGEWIIRVILTADWVATTFEEVISDKINPTLNLQSTSRDMFGAVSRVEKGKESVP